MIAVILVSVVGIAAAVYWYLGIRPKNAPPGPTGLPFFGYAPFLGKAPWIAVTAMKIKYGNVTSFYLGKSLTIILQDYEAIRAGFVDQSDIFDGRGEQFITKQFSTGKDGKVHGIIALEGPKWQAARNFVTVTSSEFMKNSRFEEICLENFDRLHENIKNENGKGFDIRPKVYRAMWDMIGQLLYGRRMDSEEFNFITKEINAVYETLHGSIMQLYPWTRHLPVLSRQWGELTRSIDRQYEMFEKEIDKHEKTVSDSKARDFLDVYLRHLKAGRGKNMLAMQNNDDIITTCETLQTAAPESTTATIQWAILYLCYYPECMRKVQEELDKVIGRDRPVMLIDKQNIPYTVATWYECHRLSGNSSLGVMRSTLEDTELLGYHIPKRSFVMPNIYGVHRDSRYFPDPDVFKPERFLGADGQVVVPPQFIVFSMGKRACPGQEIARTMVFLVLANLLLRFDFRPAAGKPLAPLNEWLPGVAARAHPFDIEASPRGTEDVL